MKKVGAICNADGRYYLMDQRDTNGEIVSQWLGDGKSAYVDALSTWGAEAQTRMLFEEIGELLQAVCKASRVKNWEQRMEVWHNIAEEIADVKIMLGQMEVLFDVEDAVETCKEEKIARLVERLKKAHEQEGTEMSRDVGETQ